MALLSLAMMVKNEEAFLADALDSANGWVDELVVVDTGSTDATVRIAQDFGAKVFEFPWCDDFSAARNETIRRCTSDYVFILDADERIRGADPEAFRTRLVAGEHHPFEAWLINVVNVTKTGQPASSGFGPRVFPRDARLGYVGRVHNRFKSLDPAHPSVNASYIEGVEIIHLGYDPDVYKTRNKSERSLPLIEASLADDPNDNAMRFYLGRELARLERYDEAATVLEDTVRRMMVAPDQENLLQGAWFYLVDASRLAKRPFPNTLKLGTEALSHFPQNADLWNATGAVLLEHQQAAKSIECFEQSKRCLSRAWDDLDRTQGLALRPWELDERLGLAYAESGRLPEALDAFSAALDARPDEEPGWQPVLDATCALAEKLGDQPRLQAAEARRRKLAGRS